MNFTNPWALWFLPLAGIPVIIHFFRQRQANRVMFPDLRFLKESQTATWRATRLKEWLLLALRVLAVACIVLAMARPMADIALPKWLGGSEGLCVIVIDNSASMSTRDGDHSLFDNAKRKAVEAVSQMAANSRVAIVSAAAGNEVISGFVAPALAKQRITELPQGDRGTDIPGAIIAANTLAAQQGGTAVIVVISDLQRTGFGDLRPVPRLGAGITVRVVDVSSSRPENNLIWENVIASSLRQRIMVTARILGDVRPLVTLERKGKTYYTQQALPDAEGMAAVSFGWPDADSLTLTCSGDDLPLDDTLFIPSRRARYNCLLIADSNALFLHKALLAMAPGGFSTVRTDNPTGDQLASADLIVIGSNRVPQGLGQRVSERARDGAALLVIPPLQADPASYNRSLLNAWGNAALTGLAKRDSSAAFHLKPGPGAGALGSDLPLRDAAAAAVSAFWQARVEGSAALLTNSGQPALVVRGRTAVWLFGAEPEMSDLVYQPLFVVLLHRLVASLVDGAAGSYAVGSSLKPDPGQQLFAPDGSAAARDNNAGTCLLDRHGWYRLSGFGSERLLAVNIPAGESDAARIGERDLAGVFHNLSWREKGATGAASSPLTALLLALAFAALGAETIVRRAP